jgi:hypothetical protein
VDELCGSKSSKCPPNLGINPPPATTMEFPYIITLARSINLHHSRDLETFKGRDTGLLSGKKSASFPFEHRGLVNGLQEGQNTVVIDTNHTGNSRRPFKGGALRVSGVSQGVVQKCGNQRRRSVGWSWEWTWGLRSLATFHSTPW